MKLYFNIFLLAALVVTACQESKMTYKVKFFYFFSSPQNDKSPGTTEIVSFHFYRLDYNDPKDTAHYDAKILLITIPDTDSVFSLKSDSLHRFLHTYQDASGKIINEEVASGEISGFLISKGVWQISAKTKYFDFVKCIPEIDESKHSYHETFTLN